MIINIGGKYVDPAQVALVEYLPGNERCSLHLSTGKYVEVHLPQDQAVALINEAIQRDQAARGLD